MFSSLIFVGGLYSGGRWQRFSNTRYLQGGGVISLDMGPVAIASVSCRGQSGRGLSFAKRMPFAVAVSVAKS